MCILFVKTHPNPESDEYKLILVNIRDEYFARPTETVNFWDNDRHIIAAKDLEKGREGGTWIGMNTNGKIGTLLNIFQPKQELSASNKRRGFLVVDYLNSNSSAEEYLKQLSDSSMDYNGFRMIAMHVMPESTDICVLSNFEPKVVELSSGIHIFGNNKIEGKLWPKVMAGRQQFEDIVSKYNKTCCKVELIDAIYQLLSDKTMYPLDEQMKGQGRGHSNEFLKKLNAINVFIPEYNYGSRTWTIILVDSRLNVEYIEKTMKEPIDVNEDILWITNEKKFTIH